MYEIMNKLKGNLQKFIFFASFRCIPFPHSLLQSFCIFFFDSSISSDFLCSQFLYSSNLFLHPCILFFALLNADFDCRTFSSASAIFSFAVSAAFFKYSLKEVSISFKWKSILTEALNYKIIVVSIANTA